MPRAHKRFRWIGMTLWISILSCPVGFSENSTTAEREPFSIVLLPDTQYYSEKFPETYKIQTKWIRANAITKNIKFVIHLGDIVQNRHERETEWYIARYAHKLLDGVVPYSVAPGNHDMVVEPRDTSLFNKYFPSSDYDFWDWYGGNFGDKNDSNYCFFNAAGMSFLILNLEYAPGDDVLAWANTIVEKYKHHRTIVATHHYLRPGGRGEVGERMWNTFVKNHKNIFLVVCGHVGALTLQNSINDAGNMVYEILTDYQGMENGGNGWLRILTFTPDKNVIEVQEYSPLLKQSRRAISHNYRLYYDMRNAN